MALIDVARPDELERSALKTSAVAATPSPSSAVSWGAILAGAAGAAALSMVMLILGTGLGLSSVSPWAGSGISATTFGVSTILWLSFTQVFASGIGGYLAGRLRTRWTSVHSDEVYFRDTAHGFLAWAVASLATAALLTSTIGAILGTGVQAGASAASGAATTATAATAGAAAQSMGTGSAGSSSRGEGPMGYMVDSLFRSGEPGASAAAPADAASAATPSVASAPAMGATATPAAAESRGQAAPAAEVGRIFANALRSGNLPAEDSRYLAQLVAERTGVSQQEAERRVSTSFDKLKTSLRDAEVAARDAADKARKASAYGALWLFVSLMIGAFVASLAATYGGRQRQA